MQRSFHRPRGDRTINLYPISTVTLANLTSHLCEHNLDAPLAPWGQTAILAFVHRDLIDGRIPSERFLRVGPPGTRSFCYLKDPIGRKGE